VFDGRVDREVTTDSRRQRLGYQERWRAPARHPWPTSSVVLAVREELATDLARGVRLRVDVGVGVAGPDGRYDLRERWRRGTTSAAVTVPDTDQKAIPTANESWSI
jgi:hypothetical protein